LNDDDVENKSKKDGKDDTQRYFFLAHSYLLILVALYAESYVVVHAFRKTGEEKVSSNE